MIEIIILICQLFGSCMLGAVVELFFSNDFNDVTNTNELFADATVDSNRPDLTTIMAYSRGTHYKTQKMCEMNVEECNNYFNSEQGKLDQELVNDYIKFLQNKNK